MKRFLLITFVTLSLNVIAQTNNYPTAGDVTIYSYSPNLILQRNTNDGGFTEGIQTKLLDGTDNWFFGALHAGQWIVSKGNYANIKMTILSNGNVGIGTTNPQAKLDVGSDISDGSLGTVFGRLPEGNNSGTGTFLGVRGYATQGEPNRIKSFAIEHSFYGVTNSSIGFYRGGDISGGFLTFSTNSNNEQVRITSSGSVGIGTTTPDQKLTVKGKIHAEEVIVDLNVPVADYVFAKDYSLMPLHKVEQYVKTNSHLPDIPSAAEIKEQGLSIGEIQNKLLQKVEEQTLYIIGLNNELQELKKQLKELQKKK